MFKDKFAASFREIGRDLLNLEINTIVKPNLTSLKMPALPHALLDIASLYRSTLMEKLDLTSMWQIPQDQRSSWQPQFLMPGAARPAPLAPVCNGLQTFDRLRWAAARTLCDPKVKNHFNEAESVILYRIRRNCDQLKNIIRDLMAQDPQWNLWLDENDRAKLITEAYRSKPLGRMPVDHAVAIRKIWDMGVENIAMQTVIQIDGDVITRIQSGMSVQTKDLVLNVHGLGVDMTMKYWQTLFDIIKEVAGGLKDLFLPRK